MATPALVKFCKKHFNYNDQELLVIKNGILLGELDEEEFDGMSEYDLVDYIDGYLIGKSQENQKNFNLTLINGLFKN